MDSWYDQEKKKLRAAEEAAVANQPEEAEDSLDGARKAEEGFYSGGRRPNDAKKSLYTGKGKENAKAKGKKSGLKPKALMKKGGPIGAITLLIGVVGGFLGGAQAMMPVAISEMMIEKFNSVGISSTMTSDVWLNTQLNYGVRTGNLESGATDGQYAFSEYQVKQFETYGMKVVQASGATAILYNKNGAWIAVVGSNHLNSVNLGAISAEAGVSVSSVISAEEALKDDDFRTPYTTAAKTWRGGSSGWFDEMMDKVTEAKLGINRNRWAKYASKSLGKMTEEFKQTAKSLQKERTTDYEVNAEKTFEEDPRGEGGLNEGDTFVPTGNYKEEGWSSNGNPNGEVMTVIDIEEVEIKNDKGEVVDIDYIVRGNNNSNTINGAKSAADLEISLSTKATKAAAAADAGSLITGGVNIVCSAIEGLMSIYTVVSAYQSLQFLNVISGFLESVDKMKAGNGDGSPIHEYSTNLTTLAPAVEEDGESDTVQRTAMESAGMSWLFSDEPINSNDPSVQNTNFESIMTNLSSLTSDIQITAKMFETCGYAKVGAAALDLVITGMSFIPILGQAITFTQVASKIAAEVVVNGVVQLFFQAAIPVIVKKIVNSIIEDAATEWFGEDLGNAMLSGASKYLGGNGSSGGQGPGSEAKVIAYLNEQATVIAEEAEYQRSIRSPFDITSPYTFLGSLAYSVLPLAYSNSGVMSTLTKVSDLTNSSLVAMLPTATAVGVNETITSKGDCPLLEGIGAIGDAYCNAYIITDTATIDEDPVTVEDKVKQLGNNFNADGTINKKSDLAKYITYCGKRTSQYGLKDSSVVEGLTEEATANQQQSSGGFFEWLGQLIGVIPVLGETQTILQSINDAGLMQWTTGQACVVSDDNEFWSEDEHEYRYYQRYAENQRLVENINPGYKSTVTAYLENHYIENPIDDSFEGQLARFSGMSKEEVTDTLALIEYYQYIAEYDASERYAFLPTEKEGVKFDFNNENVIAASYYVVPNEIIFADVRNRQTTVI